MEQKGLALAVLEATACAGLTILLTLLHTRIACQQPCGLQQWTQVRVHVKQGTGNPMACSPSLSGHTPATDIDANIQFVGGIGQVQGKQHIVALNFHWEVILNVTAIHGHFAGSGCQTNAGNRGLPTASSQIISGLRHVLIQ